MGCDIHVFLESPYWKPEANAWTMDKEIEVNRDYTLFSLLAGVRGSFDPLVPPRGLPEDLAFETLAQVTDPYTADMAESYGRALLTYGPYQRMYNPDYHTHSWLTKEELLSVLGAYESVRPGQLKEYNPDLQKWSEWMDDNQRIVFWFDN